MNNKYIYEIDVCKADTESLRLARLIVKIMSDLDINMTALNRRYLKASNNFFSSWLKVVRPLPCVISSSCSPR